jgi:hypothetical protein
MSAGDEENGGDSWDRLKKTPATIVVDGLSINDYLSLIRDQVNHLREQSKQQNNIINGLKKELENEKEKNKETTDRNDQLLQRIIALENRPHPDLLQATLNKHEEDIKELTTRPIVDLGEGIRLSIVEKKLASFYGDDINILGRVRHPPTPFHLTSPHGHLIRLLIWRIFTRQIIKILTIFSNLFTKTTLL